MDPVHETLSASHPAVRARKTRGRPATPRAAQPPPSARKAQRAPREPDHDPPYMPLDAEVLADLQEFSTRKLRALVRERPLVWMGGALATGFLVGGGWKTRVGRLVLLAGVRYAAVQAAERYFNE